MFDRAHPEHTRLSLCCAEAHNGCRQQKGFWPLEREFSDCDGRVVTPIINRVFTLRPINEYFLSVDLIIRSCDCLKCIDKFRCVLFWYVFKIVDSVWLLDVFLLVSVCHVNYFN